MNILTIDFETYYDSKYQLKKLTTEDYIRHPDFEVIGVSVQINEEEPEWHTGTFEEINSELQQYGWESSIAIAHNAMFDAAILNWKFGISPLMWIDTLSMARAVQKDVNVGGSLKELAQHYKLGRKGTEVLDAKGKRRVTFPKHELDKYGQYCCNDVRLTYKLYK